MIVCDDRDYLGQDNTTGGRPCRKEAINFYLQTSGPIFQTRDYFAMCDIHYLGFAVHYPKSSSIHLTESINKEDYLTGIIHDT